MPRHPRIVILFATFLFALLMNSATNAQVDGVTVYLPVILDTSWGGKIVFEEWRADASDLFVLDMRTQNMTRLTNTVFNEKAPAWSPDGAHIAFSASPNGNYDIFVMDSTGANVQRLTSSAENDEWPAWSPDGSRIAFIRSYSTTVASLLVMEVDGANPTRLTTGAIDWAPDWSPDGNTIVFASDRTGDWEIDTIDPAGAQRMRMTQNDFVDFAPSWSPDGTQILAGAQGRAGNTYAELYVMSADGAEQEYLSIPWLTPNGGHDWAPDGKGFVFGGSTKLSRELYTWQFDREYSDPLTSSELWSNVFHEQPDWTP